MTTLEFLEHAIKHLDSRGFVIFNVTPAVEEELQLLRSETSVLTAPHSGLLTVILRASVLPRRNKQLTNPKSIVLVSISLFYFAWC